MSRYRDHDQLDGGSALWKRADDEKFWLEGDSDDEEAEIGWTPGLKSDLNTNKNQKNKKQWIEEDDSEGDGASSSSEVDEGEEHDLLAGSAKAAGSNPPQKKREAWEKKWDDKFKALYDAIPRRKPQTQASADAAQFTDAILSCPGCFSVLCEMCQRHEVDFNRWRALEVTSSCKVDKTQRKTEADYGYYPVSCGECGAIVGAFDDDQTYHLYNVVPSSADCHASIV